MSSPSAQTQSPCIEDFLDIAFRNAHLS